MRKKIIISLGYFGFFIFAFIFSLYLTFNPAQIKTWLEANAGKRGVSLTISRLDKYRLSGVRAREITLQTKGGKLIKIDQLKARLSLLPLILGREKIGFQIVLYGGKLSGDLEQARRGFRTSFNLQNINLGSMQAGSQGGFWIAAKLSGKGNLNLAPKNNPKAWSGKIDAELSPGTIPSFAYKGFQVPEIKIDQVKFNLELNNGNAQIKTFDLKSPDFPIQGKGQIEFRDPVLNSLINLEAKVNPSQQFLEKIRMLESILPPNRTVTYNGTLGGIISGY